MVLGGDVFISSFDVMKFPVLYRMNWRGSDSDWNTRKVSDLFPCYAVLNVVNMWIPLSPKLAFVRPVRITPITWLSLYSWSGRSFTVKSIHLYCMYCSFQPSLLLFVPQSFPSSISQYSSSTIWWQGTTFGRKPELNSGALVWILLLFGFVWHSHF